MSEHKRGLPPCDHDECGPNACKREVEGRCPYDCPVCGVELTVQPNTLWGCTPCNEARHAKYNNTPDVVLVDCPFCDKGKLHDMLHHQRVSWDCTMCSGTGYKSTTIYPCHHPVKLL